MTDSAPWYRGATLPNRGDGWEVTAVAHRSIASDETVICEVTGQSVPAKSTRLLVTIHRKGMSRDETEQFVVVDEDTLRGWLELEE
ncbi:hypothetical protein SAMN04488063_3169 [Halopelagius inordinatus]|uniref:Uncharacterized protein n=1 Tax=Halopelagius inordinatus TaxID=553467 RepID=A0A1I2VD83_9EURY|nr:hypothetical protein [Halopelagius inordinatus]SFG87172.1 hypothetical protein SAMN04488063_3169 [Halopelagius inordinatus]